MTRTQRYLNRFSMVPLTAVAVGVLALNVRAWNSHVGMVYGQQINVGDPSTPPRGKGHVSFTAEPQTVEANHPVNLLLHFHVDPGFHINSHTPKSEMLIPTKIAVEYLSSGNVSDV